MKVYKTNPNKKRERFNKTAYNRQYNETQQLRKQIYFNKNIPEDIELYEMICKHKNFTRYIKRLIRKDIEACREKYGDAYDSIVFDEKGNVSGSAQETIFGMMVSGEGTITYSEEDT